MWHAVLIRMTKLIQRHHMWHTVLIPMTWLVQRNDMWHTLYSYIWHGSFTLGVDTNAASKAGHNRIQCVRGSTFFLHVFRQNWRTAWQTFSGLRASERGVWVGCALGGARKNKTAASKSESERKERERERERERVRRRVCWGERERTR